MKILFRYDDVSESSDIKFDIEILETIISEGFTPMIGVIPYIADIDWEIGEFIPLKKLTLEKINLFKKFNENQIEFALHGFTHQAITSYSGMSEFGSGVSYIRNYERLLKGKQFLEDSFGKEIKWFIPPWNVYSENTLNALYELGFKGISADASHGLINDKLSFAPQTCQISELYNAVNYASNNPSSLIIVMLHQYDFTKQKNDKNKINLVEFKKMLNSLKIYNNENFNSLLETNQFHFKRAQINQEIRKKYFGPIKVIKNLNVTKVYWGEKDGMKELNNLKMISNVIDKSKDVLRYLKK